MRPQSVASFISQTSCVYNKLMHAVAKELKTGQCDFNNYCVVVFVVVFFADGVKTLVSCGQCLCISYYHCHIHQILP